MYHLPGEVNAHTGQLVKSIAKLAGLLSVHLAAEDKYLYPKLMGSSDENVKQCAKEFVEEMSGLADKFHTYSRNYNVVAKITSSPNKYLTDTKAILDALLVRVRKEEDILFPMVK